MKRILEIVFFGLGPFIVFWTAVLMTGCETISPSPKNIVDSTKIVGYVYDKNCVCNDNNFEVIYVRNGLTSEMYVVPNNSVNVGDSIVHSSTGVKPIEVKVDTLRKNSTPIK